MHFWNCRICSKEMQKARGCKRPTKGKVWEIKKCFVCGGNNKKCKHCNGTNRIHVNQCPKALTESETISYLIPYCYHYLEFGKFPNGEGMMYQPAVLLDALNLFISYYRQYEKEDYERRMREL